jgi:hypothetical protein
LGKRGSRPGLKAVLTAGLLRRAVAAQTASTTANQVVALVIP